MPEPPGEGASWIVSSAGGALLELLPRLFERSLFAALRMVAPPVLAIPAEATARLLRLRTDDGRGRRAVDGDSGRAFPPGLASRA